MAQAKTDVDAAEKTHLIARTRGAREFRRGGIVFTPVMQAFLLADFDPRPNDRLGGRTQLQAILDEGMIESHLATAAEASKYAATAALEFDANISRAELIEHIQRQNVKISSLTERIAAMEQRLQGDVAPRRIEDLPPATTQLPGPGQGSGNPTHPAPRQRG